MEELKRRVSTARRRMILQQFLSVLPWSLFAMLLVAAIGIAIPKIWVVSVDPSIWTASWVGGSICAGIVFAMIWTSVVRHNLMDAAIEVDRRFGLKERVSSALSLAPDELESEPGRALVSDASRRVEVISVSDEFSIRASWRSLLPLAPAFLVFMLALFVGDAQPEKQAQASNSAAVKERIKKSTRELQNKIRKRREAAKQKGLKDAEQLFDKLKDGIDDLNSREDLDRKQALVKINDLAKEIEKRRNALGDSDKMKKQFEKLKNLERGPAEKVTNAMKEGNFQKAINELKQLQEKLASGEMSDEDKKQLAQQMKQMQQKMQEMADAQKQAKEDLDKQIKQKMREGDLEGAGKLQRKLDELSKQDRQMERLEKMANQLAQSQQAMQEGDAQAAAEQLEQLASELEAMEAELSELESLDEIMDEIANAKDAMRDGEGQSDMFSDFGGMGDRFGDMPGDGMNEGRGFGYRPEEETETGEYNARERVKPKAGEAVRVGDVIGPNKSGLTQEQIKEQILSSLSEDADPLTEQKLPRSQREHVNEYFQRLRDGD